MSQNYSKINTVLILGLFCAITFLNSSALLAAEGELESPSTRLISLPLQIHLVTSKVDLIHATSKQDDLDRLLERINTVWAVAGIHWTILKTVSHALPEEEKIIAAMTSNQSQSRGVLLDALMAKNTNPDVWNLFIVHDLTKVMGIPGVYVPSRQNLIISEIDPAGLNDPGRIAAHELGHSLNLQHVACVSKGNLMAAACPSVNRTRLEPAQIEDARRQAKRGVPVPR